MYRLQSRVEFTGCRSLGSKKGDKSRRNQGRLFDGDKVSIEEKRIVESALEAEPFNQYIALWSLADWRYAGTLVLIKTNIEVNFGLN